MSDFKPHGFIHSIGLELLYRQAHYLSWEAHVNDPREHQTIALAENILNKDLLAEHRDIYVNSQWPPHPQSDNRMDIGINYFDGKYHLRILCIMEFKRTSRHKRFDLARLEDQALGYCKEAVEPEQQAFTYAFTGAGAHLRAWKYVLGDKRLTPIWPLHAKYRAAEWHEYKDLGIDNDAELIRATFGAMLRMPPTARAGEAIEAYGAGSAPLVHQIQSAERGPQRVEVEAHMHYGLGGDLLVTYSLSGENVTTKLEHWVDWGAVVIHMEKSVYFKRDEVVVVRRQVPGYQFDVFNYHKDGQNWDSPANQWDTTPDEGITYHKEQKIFFKNLPYA